MTPAMLSAAAAFDCCCTGSVITGTTTDIDVANAVTNAYLRQRQNFPLVCGATPHEEEKRQRRLKTAVYRDVRIEFGLGALGLLLAIVGGPAAVFMAIATAVFTWLVEKELTNHYGALAFDLASAALGAA